MFVFVACRLVLFPSFFFIPSLLCCCCWGRGLNDCDRNERGRSDRKTVW
ncbi:hypothetical protein LMJF_10_1215 [Leishmania major strain Friedlin]|uniref:Uncharacterized protein n=1 Tax=Leishmania major TaxID=5664 RepID=E9ACQ9_LEIMA|nr:hypothetical protein LMJF_10_1215 [Leishmania major strain Friedlin]CBZ05799.1 hypothetical protein LMJF_10_1215 [Leishmania major strain Friedlin]|eukprot:XP_003721783.1 hypothetical protein LMJF_10_1215 [Leishmania major strain Friedlin]